MTLRKSFICENKFISFPIMDNSDFLLIDDNEVSTSDDIHDDLNSDDEIKVPIVQKRKRINSLSSTLEKVSKQLAMAQQKDEKQKELTTCYICLSKMKWPLQVCELGHFACADCIHKQMRSAKNLWRTVITTGLIPVCTFEWKINFPCGLCKTTANPKYPGALVTQLIDPEPILTCPTCNRVFSESAIGMHIAFCDHNTTICPLCTQSCKIVSVNEHISNHCQKTQCKRCKFTSNFARMKQHMIQHELFDRTILALPKLTQNISHIGMNRFHLVLPIITAFHNLLKSENVSFDYDETICEEMKKLLTELGM